MSPPTIQALPLVVRTFEGLSNELAQIYFDRGRSTPCNHGNVVDRPSNLGVAHMEPTFLLIGLLFLGLGIAVGATLRHVDHLERLTKEQEKQLAKRRHTYPTADGLEDAMAVAIELLLRQDAENKYREARYGQLREIIGKLREGPQEYDRDRPNNRPNHDT